MVSSSGWPWVLFAHRLVPRPQGRRLRRAHDLAPTQSDGVGPWRHPSIVKENSDGIMKPVVDGVLPNRAAHCSPIPSATATAAATATATATAECPVPPTPRRLRGDALSARPALPADPRGPRSSRGCATSRPEGAATVTHESLPTLLARPARLPGHERARALPAPVRRPSRGSAGCASRALSVSAEDTPGDGVVSGRVTVSVRGPGRVTGRTVGWRLVCRSTKANPALCRRGVTQIGSTWEDDGFFLDVPGTAVELWSFETV